MQALIEIEGRIVVTDILTERFCCDLAACRENGTTLCAIEKAWREGRTAFRKPVSCHLYPIRVTKFSDGSEGLHYHRWDICAPARRYGRKTGIRVYESLREPIIRKFGAEFYKELDAAAKYMEKEYRTE